MTAATCDGGGRTEGGARATAGLDPLLGIRWLAALSVVLHHADLLSMTSAVPLFFVLSGFILAYRYTDERGLNVDVRTFWLLRLSRIYPAYALALFLVVCVTLWNGQVVSDQAGSLVASVLMVQAWSPRLVSSWNWPAWTVSCEAFFYLLFPLAAWLALRLATRRALLCGMALSWAVGVGVAAVFQLHQRDGAVLLPTDPLFALVKYAPLARLPEFVMGVLLGRLYVLRRPDAARDARVGSGLSIVALVLAVFLTLGAGLPYIQVHNALLAPVYAVLIWGLAMGGVLARLLSHPVMIALGESSYAFYIVQAPAGSIFTRVTGLARDGAASTLLFTILLTLLSLALFYGFERPLMRWVRVRFVTPRPPRPLAVDIRTSLAWCVVVAAVAAPTAVLPQHLGPRASALAAPLAVYGATQVAWDANDASSPYLLTLTETLPAVTFTRWSDAEAPPFVVTSQPVSEVERRGLLWVARERAGGLSLYVRRGSAACERVCPPLGAVLGTRPVLAVEERGFHPPEIDARGRPVRWTTGVATLRVPLGADRPSRLRLEAEGPGPLEVRVDGVLVHRGRTPVELPVTFAGDVAAIELRAPTFVPAQVDARSRDARCLGAAVYALQLLP